MNTNINIDHHLKNYKEDLREAHKIYANEVITHTIDMYGVIPMNEEEIYTLSARARAKKAQASGVATKRLKAAVTLEYLDLLAPHFDLTFTLATKLTTALLGRSINPRQLLEHFATPGRNAGDKSADLSEVRFKIILSSEPYQACRTALNHALDQLETLKGQVMREKEMEVLSDKVKACLINSLKAHG